MLVVLLWYSWIIVMTCVAARFILAVFPLSSMRSVVKVCDVCLVLALVELLPSRYTLTRYWGWRE